MKKDRIKEEIMEKRFFVSNQRNFEEVIMGSFLLQKSKMLNMTFVILYLVLGFTIIGSPLIDASKRLDTPEIVAEMEKAKNIAGNDQSLVVTFNQQSKSLIDLPQVHIAPGSELHATPTQLFDNLYYVGGTDVGVFIFTTPEGYIMIDSGYSYMPEDYIIPDMKKLGLDPNKIKYILITHAGPDHTGGAKYFQEKYGTKIVMSKEEWKQAELAKEKAKNNSTNNSYMMWPEQDIVGQDGGKITLGNTTITMVHTPRTVNGGGLSYIAEVFDNGESHTWATYGNTNVVGTLADKKVYRDSVAKFLTYIDNYKVDVLISNHPFVDGSLSVMDELRNSKKIESNQFVLGQERVEKFFKLLDQCAVILTLRQEAGLDETGTKRLASN